MATERLIFFILFHIEIVVLKWNRVGESTNQTVLTRKPSTAPL